MTKLQEYLNSHGISRKHICRETGIDLRTVSALCRGNREGNMWTWKQIARVLGCTLDEIVDK